MEGTPLLDVMRGLILEPEAQADFAADPSGYMQRFGYDDVPEEDLREAVGLVADTLPPDTAHAVNTAAAAEPSDDAYGDGTIGLLGRISSAEVTESVVPELDDLPDAPDDPGGDDPFGDDHDATAFGDADFDDADGSADDPHGAGDDTEDTAADGSADDDTGADDTGAEASAGDDAGDLADAAGSDVSFGDGGIDESFDDVTDDALDEAEAFGQGSAPVDDGTATEPDGPGGGFEPPAGAGVDDSVVDSFDTGDDAYDDTFDDGGGTGAYDDAFDDELGGDGGLDTGDDVDGGLDDGLGGGDAGDIGDF